MLSALSPLDGRYESKIKDLKPYFSEEALIKYRVLVEIRYFLFLSTKVPQLANLSDIDRNNIETILSNFSTENAESIKATERITNHDVKAVEYFIKEKFTDLGISEFSEFIHFGLTSQDINNTESVPFCFSLA